MVAEPGGVELARLRVRLTEEERPLGAPGIEVEGLPRGEDRPLEIPFAEAARVLARAKALAASVRSRVEGSGALWRDIEARLQDTPAWRRENAELLLDITVLRETLRRIRHGRKTRPPAPA